MKTRLFFISFMAYCQITSAQISVFSEIAGLKSGEHLVGIKRMVVKDYGRWSGEKTDFRQNKITTDAGFSITLMVWYPAVGGSYKASQYVNYTDTEIMTQANIDTLSSQQKIDLQKKILSYLSPEDAQKVIDKFSTSSIYNVKPKAGKYPLVLSISTSPGFNEYLASLGYVVVRMQSSPSDRANLANRALGYYEDITNVLFIKNYVATNFKNVDIEKTALIGFSYYGSVMQLVQMRSAAIDAVISLDGTEAWNSYKDMISQNIYFKPQLALSPILRFHNAGHPEVNWDYFYKQAVNADQWLLSMQGITHSDAGDLDFSNAYDKIIDDTTDENKVAKQRAMWLSAKYFLNYYLKDDRVSVDALNDMLQQNKAGDIVFTKKASAPIREPSNIEMSAAMDSHGIAGLKNIRQLMADSAHLLTVTKLYNFSYTYRFSDRKRAIDVMRYAVEIYPQSLLAKYWLAMNYSQDNQFSNAVSTGEEALNKYDMKQEPNDMSAQQYQYLKQMVASWKTRITNTP